MPFIIHCLKHYNDSNCNYQGLSQMKLEYEKYNVLVMQAIQGEMVVVVVDKKSNLVLDSASIKFLDVDDEVKELSVDINQLYGRIDEVLDETNFIADILRNVINQHEREKNQTNNTDPMISQSNTQTE